MSIGVTLADAIAAAAAQGMRPGPGATPARAAKPGARIRRESAFAGERVSNRWSGFMVAAALRAAGDAAAQRP